MNKKLAKELKSYLLIALGSSVYAFGYVMFFLPNQIPLGGIIGLATIFNTLFAAPLGITNILLNVAIFLLFCGGYHKMEQIFFSGQMLSGNFNGIGVVRGEQRLRP